MQGSFLRRLVAAVVLMLGASCAMAQAWPGKPVTIVVGFAPGGSTDKLARLLGQAMQEHLGQQVIIDNKPGAAGNVAAQAVAASAPNGYTLFMTTLSSAAVNPWIYPNARLDPIKSYEPVALVARYPLVMAVNPGLNLKTTADVIRYLREKKDAVSFSSAGTGSPAHLAGELINAALGTKMMHVPYKGGGPAMLAAMSGEVALTIETSPAMIPHVKSGKLTGIAVSSATRSRALPDLPTLAESGVPGFEVTSWAGLVAPAGTPAEVLEKLQNAIVRAMDNPKLQAALDADGAAASYLPGEKFRAFNESELKRWGEVVRSAKVRAE